MSESTPSSSSGATTSHSQRRDGCCVPIHRSRRCLAAASSLDAGSLLVTHRNHRGCASPRAGLPRAGRGRRGANLALDKKANEANLAIEREHRPSPKRGCRPVSLFVPRERHCLEHADEPFTHWVSERL